MKGKKIEGIQALRGWAFLGVFLHHCAFFFDWGYVGVSVFFVLSGFFVTLKAGEDDPIPSPFMCIKKALLKTWKLYPLHIITMCFMTPLVMDSVIYGWQLRPVRKQFFLNIFLLQSWSPDHYDNISFNGVSWFLSTMMFLYIVIPYFAYFVRKHDKRISLMITIIAIPVQIAACMVYLKYKGVENIDFDWFSYVFPLAHLVDTFAGCCFARFYLDMKEDKEDREKIKWSLIEFALITATGLLCWWMDRPTDDLVLKAVKNNTILYIPFATIWIWVFIAQKGVFSRFFGLKPFKWLGDMSGNLYLVHFVVIQYIWDMITKQHIRFRGVGQMILSSAGLAVSILICVVIRLLEDVIKKSRRSA